ncbi:MAG TPA: prolyl oligopeptidase family serine peptidase [Streptosporangiaceae bacterium]|jgi:dipeptidyl aminopeptidase/acylaminoacyl peptidase
MTGQPARLTPELALSLRGPADVAISPDGLRVAYTVGDLAAAGTRHPLARVMVSELADGQPGPWPAAAEAGPPPEAGQAVPVTGPAASAASPRWSPDSAALCYLLAPPDGEHALFTASPWDAPPRRLGASLGPVSAPAWSPDGTRIAVLASEPEERGSPQAGPDWLPAPRRARIWILDPAADTAVPGSPDTVHVWEYSWSPDGTRFAAVVSDEPGEGDWFTSRLALTDAAGAATVIDGHAREPGEPDLAGICRQIADPVWSPDGRRIAVVMGARSDRDIIGGDLCVVDLRTGALANLTRGQPVTVTSLAWPRPGALTFAAYVSGQQAVGQASPGGGPPRIRWRDRASFERFWPRISVSRDGLLATTREDPLTPREVWTARGAGDGLDWRQLTDLNPAARSWPHPDFHDVSWQAADGTRLSGILIVPAAAGPPPPLVTWIHGGPNFLHKHLFFAAASPWILGALPELIAADQIAVFLPNPRGSMGWGSAFAEAVIGDMAGADAADILAGIDHCVASYPVDAGRLGVGGWSYGGFMSAWLITQTSRFDAAVVGAGNSNWRSQHGTSSVGAWDQLYLRDDPYRIGGAYDTRSPLTYAQAVTTPTLLAHGTADSIVPPGQAAEFATGLRQAGCPVRLRFYPGEGHDFARRDTQVALAGDITGWYRRWLLG